MDNKSLIEKYSILLVEDEKDLVTTLRDKLEKENFLVTTAREGREGQRIAETGEFHCIVLDVMLPERDGFQVCRNLREQGINTPVIMLTARDTDFDTVTGLSIGADDYLTKPFSMNILIARIHALIRRFLQLNQNQPAQDFCFGEFFLSREKKQLYKGDEIIELTSREYKLLEFFLLNSNCVLSRGELLNEVWGYDSITTTRTVDVHIAWIRRKIGEKEIQKHLLTVHGFGYKFVV
jgi:DNA-binding response OmpR family regulator